MSGDLGMLFDLAWKLLLVLGLAVLAARGLRWLSTPSGQARGLIDVVARVPVGPQQNLVLVAVGKKRLLVGQTAQQITLLADLDAQDLLPDEDPPFHVPPPARSRSLHQLFSPRQGSDERR